jgi:hypothetical protein
MTTTRHTAVTAVLATTAAVAIAGVSWGIGATLAGEGLGDAAAVTPTAIVANPVNPDDSGTSVGRGPGRGNGHSDTMVGQGYGRGGGGSESGRGWRSGEGAAPGWTEGTEPGARWVPGAGNHDALPPAVPGATIDDALAEQLTYLVEEEKLAGDVYELARSRYGARVFGNIARAEDNHADAVRVLLARYSVADPTVDAAAGEFTDPELQSLYDSLAAQVRSSWSEAVAAGILIEQTDIADLEELLAGDDLPSDVREVTEHLLSGSQRHLAAFQRQAA